MQLAIKDDESYRGSSRQEGVVRDTPRGNVRRKEIKILFCCNFRPGSLKVVMFVLNQKRNNWLTLKYLFS